MNDLTAKVDKLVARYSKRLKGYAWSEKVASGPEELKTAQFDFSKSGPFTTCTILTKVSGNRTLFRLAVGVAKRSAKVVNEYGFVTPGDRQNKEIGEDIALARALKSFLLGKCTYVNMALFGLDEYNPAIKRVDQSPRYGDPLEEWMHDPGIWEDTYRAVSRNPADGELRDTTLQLRAAQKKKLIHKTSTTKKKKVTKPVKPYVQPKKKKNR